jgi:hypothetical protein
MSCLCSCFLCFCQPIFPENTTVEENANPQPTGPTNSNAMECSYLLEEHISNAEDIQESEI